MGGLILLLILILEWVERLAAELGLVDVAGQACHLAVTLGMFGPCQP